MIAIWIWIAAAFLLSWLIVAKKNIGIYHYIWLLMPIDCYGISTPVGTLKPYMLFIFGVFIFDMFRYKGKISFFGGIRSFAVVIGLFVVMLLSSYINGSINEALTRHIMFLLVCLAALFYAPKLESKESRIDMYNAVTAASIGYGSVFLFAQFSSYFVSIPGVITNSRYLPGMIMNMKNYSHGRLRGFFIDPNVVILCFVLSSAIAFYGLFGKDILERSKAYYISVFVFTTLCVYYSKSRTGLFCIIALLLLIFIFSFIKAKNKTGYFLALLFIAVCLLVLFLFKLVDINAIFNLLFKEHLNRASLTDEDYGRFSLWQQSLQYSFNHAFWFGTGQDGITNAIGHHPHNTWLMWLVDIGFLQGIIINLFFFGSFIWCYTKKRILKSEFVGINGALRLGLFVYIIALLLVDNGASSYLIFSFIIVTYLHTEEANQIYVSEGDIIENSIPSEAS